MDAVQEEDGGEAKRIRGLQPDVGQGSETTDFGTCLKYPRGDDSKEQCESVDKVGPGLPRQRTRWDKR